MTRLTRAQLHVVLACLDSIDRFHRQKQRLVARPHGKPREAPRRMRLENGAVLVHFP